MCRRSRVKGLLCQNVSLATKNPVHPELRGGLRGGATTFWERQCPPEVGFVSDLSRGLPRYTVMMEALKITVNQNDIC